MIVDEVVKRPFSQGKVILHFFDENDKAAREFVARYLEESGRVHKMGAGRKVVYHRAHVPQTQNHLHFYLGNNHLYALNQDGSAHDASHGKQMHRWAMDAIKTKFDNFSIPPKGIIESMFVEDDRYLAEASAGPKIFIPPTAISIALNIATLSGS